MSTTTSPRRLRDRAAPGPASATQAAAQRRCCSSAARLGRRHPVRPAGAVDGPDLLPHRDRRRDQPADLFAPLTLEGYREFFDAAARGRRCSTR